MAVVAGELGSQVITFLEQVIPGFALLSPTLSFLVMVVMAILISQGAAFLLGGVISQATKKTKTQADDILVEKLRQPFAWLLFSGLVYLAFARLEFSEVVAEFIRSTLVTINIIFLAWLIARLARALFIIWEQTVAKRTQNIIDDTMLPILSKLVAATIWVVAGIVILAVFGIEIGPFLAGLGIAGIAIGFAVKDSLGNIFGGISLALDGAYKVGDKVKIGDIVGVIHDVTLRSTRIKTYSGDLVMVPNGIAANENVYTYAQPQRQSRGEINFGVEYGADVDKVINLVTKTVEKLDGVIDTPAVGVHFMRMGDFALEMRAYFWVDDYSQVWGIERAATKAIYDALNKAKIGIPYPTQTVHVKK